MELLALVRLFEAHELAAWRSIYQSPPAALMAQLGVGCFEHAGALLLWNRAAPVPILSRLIGLGVFAPADGATLDLLLSRSRAERCPCLVPVAPSAQPADLGDLLVARGLRTTDLWQVQHGLIRALSAPAVPSGYRIESVTATSAAAWAETILSGWQFPPRAAVGMLAMMIGVVQQPGWHCYAAVHEQSGAMVGGATMYLADGVAGLYFDTARSAHRRHGLQQALVLARLAEAQRQGCTRVFAPNPVAGSAARTMTRCGLDQAYERPNYLLQASDRVTR